MDDDDACPNCGAYACRYRHCGVIGCDDGMIDLYETESDPLWYDPGDTEACDECNGTGIERWCTACGWNNSRYWRKEVV